MRKVASLIVLLFAASLAANGTITYLTHTTCHTPNGSLDCTTPAINTTGASLIVVGTGDYNDFPVDITSSPANTFHPLNAYQYAGYGSQIQYVYGVATGSSQTFTCSGAIHGATHFSCFVAVFSGTDTTSAVFDVQGGTGALCYNTVTTGSITPASTGELLITAWSYGGTNGTGVAVNNGFSITDTWHGDGYANAAAAAYLIDSSASSINATWTWPDAYYCGAGIAAFKPAGATAATQIGAFSVGP